MRGSHDPALVPDRWSPSFGCMVQKGRNLGNTRTVHGVVDGASVRRKAQLKCPFPSSGVSVPRHGRRPALFAGCFPLSAFRCPPQRPAQAPRPVRSFEFVVAIVGFSSRSNVRPPVPAMWHRGPLLCFRLRVLRVLSGESIGSATDSSEPVPTTPLCFFSVFVSACSAFSAVKSLGFRCLPLHV